MYSVSAYYFGRTITELPFLIMFPLAYALIIYWAMGLNTDGSERFLIFRKNYLLLYFIFFSINNNTLQF